MRRNDKIAAATAGVLIVAAIALFAFAPMPQTQYVATQRSASYTNGTLGLRLALSINATSTKSGHSIGLVINETNMLPYVNHVTARSSWPNASGLTPGPCGPGPMPFRIAVYRGHYTASNASSASPMTVYDDYGIFSCPVEFQVSSYAFMPGSDRATVNNFASQFAVEYSYALSGFWLPGETTYPGGGFSEGVLHPFSPGVYTIAAADEWGGMVFLYFNVA